jgi:tetratricopeptide (TPR) repeat protein
MRWSARLRAGGVLGVVAATLLVSQPRPAAPSKEELLWQHRNRGKAFYENPTLQLAAVEEFQRALELAPDSARERLNYGLALLRAGRTAEGIEQLKRVQKQDPSLPHTWFNLAIQYKKAGEAEQAIAQMEQMAKLVPGDAVAQYNLGALYKLAGRNEDAVKRFLKASELGPHLAAPHFQLFNHYRLAGNQEEAKKRLARFQELKRAQELAGITEDMEWSDYSEVYDPVDPSLSSGDAADPAPVRFAARRLPGAIGQNPGAIALNFDGDLKPDLLVWSTSGGLLYRGGTTPVAFDILKAGRSFAAGDADNDGFPELCMLTEVDAQLIPNRKGSFGQGAKTVARGKFVKALWVDYDHDYDLDLILIGENPAVLRNQGEAGLVEQPGAIPFVKGAPVDAVSFRVVADSKANDLIVTYRDRESVAYRDRLAGRYDATPMPLLPQGASMLQVADWNHDGQFDLAFVTGNMMVLLANRRWTWVSQTAPVTAPASFAIEDVSNHGVFEIIAGDSIYPFTGPPRKAEGLKGGPAMVAADFNSDGRVDLAVVGGTVQLFENATRTRNRWFTAKLSGVKNRKLGEGSEIEVRSGRRYQKKIYQGFPLTFGMRGYEQIDMVRITWPNGLIQNEAKQLSGRLTEYKEAQRLSGSCPMIFTWNGSRFEFVTDVLGVAPLGAMAGDGSYFPTDHDEYVFIPGSMLRARDGAYDLRITEELSEVTYLDQLKLMTVDHPAAVEVYSNDKWKSPPYPEFRLYGTSRRVYPVRARDGSGNDVRPALAARDRVYTDRFSRRMDNTAETHSLELDFGESAPSEGAFLVLNGWVDWADGSTFRKQSQEPGAALQPPYLQVRDARGHWRTVIPDMGIPSGKTKTIAVDLSGRFLSASREIRIVSNLCVFWDEIFLGVEAGKPEIRLTELPLRAANLAFHGFSRAVIHPQRRQPEQFHYSPASLVSAWNPTSGMYTRYGDVRPLLATPDDRFVIMGSGDEVQLRFEAGDARLPAGWTRDFLLLVDGWAKDSDPNTAYSQTVEPLPFHGMSQYPYPHGEHYPEDAGHVQYRKQYNTRPALRLLRSLAR